MPDRAGEKFDATRAVQAFSCSPLAIRQFKELAAHVPLVSLLGGLNPPESAWKRCLQITEPNNDALAGLAFSYSNAPCTPSSSRSSAASRSSAGLMKRTSGSSKAA